MTTGVRASLESVRPELRAGCADAVRVFPGRPRMTLRDALRVGTCPYVAGFIAGRITRRRVPA